MTEERFDELLGDSVSEDVKREDVMRDTSGWSTERKHNVEKLNEIFRNAYNKTLEADGTVEDFMSAMLWVEDDDDFELNTNNEDSLFYWAEKAGDRYFDLIGFNHKPNSRDYIISETCVKAKNVDNTAFCCLNTPLKEMSTKVVVVELASELTFNEIDEDITMIIEIGWINSERPSINFKLDIRII